MYAYPLHRRAALRLTAWPLVASVLAIPAVAQSQALALSTAINRTGRLRALSQRTVKAYAQLVLGVSSDKSSEILLTAHKIIQTNLSELARANLPADPARLIQVCAGDAERLIALTLTAPALANLTNVNRSAEALLLGADKAVTALVSSGASATRLINIAARQRMLSQRMAKAFMLAEANVETPTMRKQISDARAEFDAALKTLEASPISTPKIVQELAISKGQWVFFQNALVT